MIIVDHQPRPINPGELGLNKEEIINSQIEIPRDKRGRIRWSVLKQDSALLISVIETESAVLLSQGVQLRQKDLSKAGANALANAISSYYPDSYYGLRQHFNLPVGADHRPRDIKTTLEVSNVVDIPRDKKGRIRWAILKKQPQVLITTIETETQRLLRGRDQLTQEILATEGESRLIHAIARFYPGGLVALRDNLGLRLGNGLGYPRSIKTGTDDIPRDRNGRIYWGSLKDNPERMLELMEKEAERLMTDPRYLAGEKVKGLPGLLFAAARYYPGGVYALKERLGLPLKEKPKGYWKDRPLEAIEEDARAFLEQEGDLTARLLRQRKQSKLIHAINRYYPGGVDGLRVKLGLDAKSKPDGYWTKENIEIEARRFHKAEGELDSTLLKQHQQSGLARAIIRYYPGGIRALREQMGLSNRGKAKGAWTPELIEKEALEFFNQEGKINIPFLHKHGRSDLASTIQTHYPGRINQLIINLSIQQPIRKPGGFWTEEEIETQAKQFFQQEGKLTNSALQEEDRQDLLGAIRDRYPGRIRALRSKLGIEEKRKTANYWTPEVIEQQTAEIYNRLHQLSVSFLRKQGLDALSDAITRHYPGGMKVLKEKLGINTDDITHTQDNQPRKPEGYWQNPENIEREAQEFYRAEGELTFGALRNKSRSDLATAIERRYPGAFRQLRIKLGLEEGRKTSGYWNPENIEKEALEFYIQERSITQGILQKRGRADLSVAITRKYPGGWSALRKKLAMPISREELTISSEDADEVLGRLIK